MLRYDCGGDMACGAEGLLRLAGRGFGQGGELFFQLGEAAVVFGDSFVISGDSLVVSGNGLIVFGDAFFIRVGGFGVNAVGDERTASGGFGAMGGGADDGRILRHVFDHGGVGADFGVFADGDGSQNLRAGADDDIVFNRGVAFAALAAVGLGAAEGNAVVHGYIVADDGGFADDDAHAVVNKEIFADLGAGVDFHAGQQPSELRQQPRRKPPALLPQAVRQAVKQDAVVAWGTQKRFPAAGGGGVLGDYRVKVLKNLLEI